MPDLFTEVIYSSFELSLEIDGEEFDVAQVSVQYSLNDIPRMSAVLSVGRDAASTTEVAKIHSKAASIRAFVPLKLTITPTRGKNIHNKKWPTDPVVLFEGYVTSLGYRSSRNQVQAIVHGIHWLSDLAATSALSAGSHPSNPMMFNTGAKARFTSSLESSGIQAAVSGLLGGNDISPTALSTDMWGELRRLMTLMAEQNFMAIPLQSTLVGKNFIQNDAAKAALQRIESPVKLALQEDLAVAATPLAAIVRSVGETLVGLGGGTTLWNHLLTLASQHGFAIVPLPEKVLVVPYVGSLKTPWKQEVILENQETIDQMVPVPRPIRAVAIFGSGNTMTSIDTGGSNSDQELELGGFFMPESMKDARGTVLVRKAPPWLAGMASEITSASETTGAKGMTPPNVDGELAVTASEAAVTAKRAVSDAYKRYAKSLYYNEVVRGRIGTWSGPVRFDIAPGSTVKLEGAKGQFIGTDELSQTVYGGVTTVAISLNAESSQASTGFQMAYVRSKEENDEEESFATDEHPLFKDPWPGANLIDELA